MSLADYLAKHYLNPSDGGEGEKKKKKRKKSKKSESSSAQENVAMVSEDVAGWEGQQETLKDEEEVPEVEDPTPTSKGGWKKLGSDSSRPNIQPPLMESGARAGLQSAAEVEADIARREEEEMRKLQEEQEKSGRKSETVYRDASGRRVDIHAQLEESRRRAQEEKLEKERRKRELNRGLVQEAEAKKEQEKLARMRDAPIARYSDDEELNEEQREQTHFQDPAAKFIVKPRSRRKGKEKTTSATGLKVYQGHYDPNRFNIPPGHLWDGVDRSNGFEARWFRKQNELKEKQTLRYTTSYDI
ncbi:hypothetical protein TRICI_002540 [Trichomonascus ciferrii]|uniref:Pre-mRNA-splicing factor CWC26 n=1 Tax=Trichomonascus ciferrii TaxID=44093 RepID=A0A642V6I2_9ASCO|nr:hypothetical protein TRICI_002540 [Trichomonascus ciferrii]